MGSIRLTDEGEIAKEVFSNYIPCRCNTLITGGFWECWDINSLRQVKVGARFWLISHPCNNLASRR